MYQSSNFFRDAAESSVMPRVVARCVPHSSFQNSELSRLISAVVAWSEVLACVIRGICDGGPRRALWAAKYSRRGLLPARMTRLVSPGRRTGLRYHVGQIQIA